MGALRAEWAKLMRWGTLVGGAGAVVGVACLATLLVFVSAKAVAPADAGRFGGITIAQLEAPDGLVQAMGFATVLVGAVSLVLFAQSVAGEYGHGTLKAILAREPRRLVVLAAKVVALALFLAVAVAAAFAAMAGVASLVAAARGIDTSRWWSGDGLGSAFPALLRLWVASLVRGLIGLTLGLAFRSAAPAIGIGLAYSIVGENLLLLAWSDGRNWLPGQVLVAFAQGGTASLSLAAASGLVAAYAALLCVASGWTFARRDVSG